MEQVNWAILKQPIKLIIAIYFNKTNAMPVVVLFQPTTPLFIYLFFWKQQRKLKFQKWSQNSRGILNYTAYNNFLYRAIHMNL
jgi:ABC-type transport system involved in cytochrome bd biosynthesis fused ATPase/permease subunit